MRNTVLLIDTNIVLDVLLRRERWYAASAEILTLCETKQVRGMLCALSIPNIIYVKRRTLDAGTVKAICEGLLRLFEIVSLRDLDLLRAAELGWPDYEDAVQYISAKRAHADYIITRNGRDFEEGDIPCLAPEEYLALIGS